MFAVTEQTYNMDSEILEIHIKKQNNCSKGKIMHDAAQHVPCAITLLNLQMLHSILENVLLSYCVYIKFTGNIFVLSVFVLSFFVFGCFLSCAPDCQWSFPFGITERLNWTGIGWLGENGCWQGRQKWAGNRWCQSLTKTVCDYVTSFFLVETYFVVRMTRFAIECFPSISSWCRGWWANRRL